MTVTSLRNLIRINLIFPRDLSHGQFFALRLRIYTAIEFGIIRLFHEKGLSFPVDLTGISHQVKFRQPQCITQIILRDGSRCRGTIPYNLSAIGLVSCDSPGRTSRSAE